MGRDGPGGVRVWYQRGLGVDGRGLDIADNGFVPNVRVVKWRGVLFGEG